MNRGYFYAASAQEDLQAAYMGWGRSANLPHKQLGSGFPDNQLSITIDTGAIVPFDSVFAGYKVFISNTTNHAFKFNAQDSRLSVKLAAEDSNGEWRYIEYLPASWCGNSYHEITLQPNSYWTFRTPKYHGEIHTRIRAALWYVDPADPKKQKTVFSNIINGSINPAQFWNKPTYHRNGIMDPYNE